MHQPRRYRMAAVTSWRRAGQASLGPAPTASRTVRDPGARATGKMARAPVWTSIPRWWSASLDSSTTKNSEPPSAKALPPGLIGVLPCVDRNPGERTTRTANDRVMSRGPKALHSNNELANEACTDQVPPTGKP